MNIYPIGFRMIPYIGYFNHNNNLIIDKYNISKPYTLDNIFLKNPFIGYIDHTNKYYINKKNTNIITKNATDLDFNNQSLEEDKKIKDVVKNVIKDIIENVEKDVIKDIIENVIQDIIENVDKKTNKYFDITLSNSEYNYEFDSEIDSDNDSDIESYEIIDHPMSNNGIPEKIFYRLGNYLYNRKVKHYN